MTRLIISPTQSIPLREIEFYSILAQGSGGQKVNKVACGIHMRFNIAASSLSDQNKTKVLQSTDSRITKDGVIVIKAQQYRSLEKNKRDAIDRLTSILTKALKKTTPRKKTKPSRASKRRRVDRKVKRGQLKGLRTKIT